MNTPMYTEAVLWDRHDGIPSRSESMSATVRINPESHRKLKALSEELGESMPTVLEQAIESLRRERFMEHASQAYGALRGDKKAWAAEQAERKAWDVTLTDGLGKESR